MYGNLKEIINKLFKCFPNSFINGHEEFIAEPKTNLYFNIGNCQSELDVKCKVLEWFSRDGSKAMPYRSREKNKKYHAKIREQINAFLGTSFDGEQMLKIYCELGNNVNRDLAVKFIMSDYDMKVLEVE